MKKIGIIVSALVLAVVALVLYATHKLTPRWPTPDEWSPIIAECARIADTAPAGVYPKDQWGPAIRSLNPHLVASGDDRINIIIGMGGERGSWGFMIYPDLRTNVTSDYAVGFEMIKPGVFKH